MSKITTIPYPPAASPILRGSQHVFVSRMEQRPPVTPKSMAEVALGSSRRLLGANSWSVRLLPGVTLGLAFLHARFYFSLFPLLDVLGKLFISFTPVLRARRPRTSGIYNQAFAEP